MLFKTGEILILTYGEYSDYGFEAVVRVKEDFESRGLARMMREQKGVIRGGDESDWKDGKQLGYGQFADLFTPWLINESGLVEELAHRELHVQDYSHLDAEVGGEGL